ncbi:MAG TPA: cytochrome P450, partial [Gammaproteobacteria bacterium]|nr:cytochrome P450 [Gammaproteobacteria bacterium]
MPVSFLDPEFQANPYAAYQWLRRHAPIYWDANAPAWDDERGIWGVTSYEHIRTVSLDQVTFTSTQGSRIDAPPVPSMINRDEPEHLLRRGVVRKRFTPQSVRAFEPFIRKAVRTLISNAGAGFDFVEKIAKPLPMMVIG